MPMQFRHWRRPGRRQNKTLSIEAHVAVTSTGEPSCAAATARGSIYGH